VTGIVTPLDERKSVGGVRASIQLTPAFRLGTADLDVADHLVKVPGLRSHRLEPLRVLLDEAMDRYPQSGAASADSWLGPRLHATLRLSRREAGNRDVWRFLGLWAADYVRWRFGPGNGGQDPDEAAKAERFVGPDSKHALGRLWWMAEVFRDGKNYESAALALTNQDIVNYLFRASISNHRPTALAAVEVLPRSKDGKSLPDGRRANALAKATNAAASTLLLDMIGPDVPPDVAARAQWEAVGGDHDPRLYFDRLPDGPDDGDTPPDAVEKVATLLRLLLAEAPVRGRKQSAS
jgi:hypothetical protein